MRVLSSLAGVFLLLTSPAVAAEKLPIFDAHMHYSKGAWEVFSPEAVLKKMKAAGVIGALASSTPDEGTQKLLKASPKVIVGGFRPYRKSGDLSRWYENPDLVPYSEKILAQGRHRSFGEVHIYSPENLETPEMAGYLKLIADKGLYLQPHSDAAVVQALFAKAPNLKIIWAHAGFSEPPSVIGPLMDRYPNLWADLSYRAGEITGDGGIDAEWRKLLIRHADRFMIGSDTWTVDRWQEYQGLIGEHREWLKNLPAETAEKIAHKNAAKLF